MTKITLGLFLLLMASAHHAFAEELDCRGGGRIISLSQSSHSTNLSLKFGPFKDRGSFVVVPVNCEGGFDTLKCKSRSWGTTLEQIASGKDTIAFKIEMDAKNQTAGKRKEEKIYVFNRSDCR